VAVSGVADHLALVNSAGNEVLLVTALTKVQSLNAGSVISLNSFSEEIADPV